MTSLLMTRPDTKLIAPSAQLSTSCCHLGVLHTSIVSHVLKLFTSTRANLLQLVIYKENIYILNLFVICGSLPVICYLLFKQVFELHDGGKIKLTIVGPDLETGQLFHYTVPPNTWFGCFPTLDVESSSPNGSSLKLAAKRDPEHHYTVLGVTCAPAFQFQDNELATSAELIALAPEAEPFIRYLGPSK
ncbi:hypothetical protein Taro_020266 [Colocasia esculenta]|uniref:DUF985 domain-containing protein n=1 Tax=Colocasia esculenta TaxID=4460 RepID=A0A843V1V8_COLES|nr:hypothetical protein [Colocasia esculenta]